MYPSECGFAVFINKKKFKIFRGPGTGRRKKCGYWVKMCKKTTHFYPE
jgi:hypothetical protein